MSYVCLQSFPVVSLPAGHPQRDEIGMGCIMVPVGFRATGVVQNSSGEIHVVGLARPNAPVAEHRVLLLFAGASVDLPIGVTLGECLGNCMVPTPAGIRPAQIFVYGEWPKSSLAALN